MGDTLAALLLFALTIGLAVPLMPFAVGLARRTVHGWNEGRACGGDSRRSPLCQLRSGVLARLAFLFVWVGVWAVGVFCAACLATAYLNDWWHRRPD